MQEPTPSFTSSKQASASTQDHVHQAPVGPSNSSKRRQTQAAALSSQNAIKEQDGDDLGLNAQSSAPDGQN